MKKTLSINIAGFVFHIEEDAYATLDAYLKSIHAYFASFEGSKEIIADIESSIAEKFWNIRETEKTEAISQAHVDALIASLGTIADFKQVEEEEDKKEGYTAPTSEEGPKVFRRDITRPKIPGSITVFWRTYTVAYVCAFVPECDTLRCTIKVLSM